MKVLSVDDNEQNRLIIERALNNRFEVISSDGNEPILPLMKAHSPSIVLLDVKLEGKTGFDLCQEIRDSEFNDVLIIFISALSSMEDKLKAYEAGGEDYICKPVQIEELKEKLTKSEKRIDEKQLLYLQLKDASNAAFISMQQASEVGQLITFFSDSVNLSNCAELFALIKEFFTAQSLHCCAEFRYNKQYFHYPAETISTLEKEILELGRSKKRFVPFGQNLLINSNYCSLLIRGLDEKDDETAGRLRDNFATLLNIINSRIMFFESVAIRKAEYSKTVERIRLQMNKDFGNIKGLFYQQENEFKNIIDELESDMNQKMMVIGLDED